MSTRSNRSRILGLAMVVLPAFVLAFGCSDDEAGPITPDPDPTDLPPGNTPEIPVPATPSEVLPGVSEDFIVGLSTELDDFAPLVDSLRVMQDDSTLVWLPMDRALTLACAGVLPRNTGDPAAVEPTYISGRPRLMHKRHWRKVKQVVLAPGTGYERQETISYGTSTSNTESREFSRTMGVEVTVGGGWGPFDASVTAYFETTTTEAEVTTVTFTEEEELQETYSVASHPTRTRVYALWQLVDEFVLVDQDTIPIHESTSLRHVQIGEIESILFPNRDTIYQSVTAFD